MKRIQVFIVLFLGLAALGNSQSVEVQNAYRDWNKGKLDKAQIAIDKASVYESTMSDPKTWLYRGGIYYDIAITPIPAFQKLSADPLQEAYTSFQRAYTLDSKKKYEEDLVPRLLAVSELYFNKGVKCYEKGVKENNPKEFTNAANHFETSMKVNEGFGKIDTLAMYNVAFLSQLSGDNEKALKYYQKLLSINYKKPNVYVSLSNVYKDLQDTAMALRIASDGRNLFNTNLDLIITETNIFLWQKKMDKAKANLYAAMQMDSTNPTIYFAVGTLWDSTGNVKEAENAYLKAIKLDPEYFDAIYNLGILYFNTGVNIFKAADALTDMKLYAQEKMKYDAMWNNAIPFLEQALILKPDDMQTMYALKQIYARLSMDEKRKALDEKMNAIEKK